MSESTLEQAKDWLNQYKENMRKMQHYQHEAYISMVALLSLFIDREG